jgi:hypothetical protein
MSVVLVGCASTSEKGAPVTVTETVTSSSQVPTTTTTPAATTTTKKDCNDRPGGPYGPPGYDCGVVPTIDGIYRVKGNNYLNGGLFPWPITTPGPRPGRKACSWARLSGPELTIANTIEGGEVRTPADGPANVLLLRSDYAFATYGCEPWTKQK